VKSTQVAAQLGVSHHTVAKARSKNETTRQIAQLKKRIGADGKRRKLLSLEWAA